MAAPGGYANSQLTNRRQRNINCTITAVLEALAGTGLPLRVRQCAVGGLPGSGTPDELMEAAGISASRIAAAARELLKD